MRPRFVGRLGAADAVTVANAALGFVAAALATAEPRLAARVILLAAMADGLDGVVARRTGGTPVGPYLDALADVASFGVAPALLVFAVARTAWGLSWTVSPRLLAAVAVPALFLAMVVVRLGFYVTDDVETDRTEGVPSTLGATILGSAVLAGPVGAAGLVAGTALLSYLLVARIEYPDLLARDVFLMGAVHGLAVIAPNAFGRAFPYALLALALTYLVLAPRFYWGMVERS